VRTFVLALTLGLTTFTTLALADEPQGAIVIRPGGSGAVPVKPSSEAPDKPGFIVIRPQGMPASPLSPQDTFPNPNKPILVGARPKPAGTGLLVPPPTPRTQPPPEEKDDGKVVLETWDAAFIKGNKVGYFHVVIREYERDGKKFRYGTKTQKLTVSRFGQVVEQWAEDATMETLDGAILVTRMRQGIGKDQMLSLTGTVTGQKLSVKIEGAAGGTQEVPWPENVVGIVKEATLLKDRKPKPGDTFEYLYYEGRLNRPVKFTVSIKDFEEVAIYEGEKPRKTLRFILGMEPIKTPGGGEFRLPPSTMWADAETFEPLKMESDMPTLGGKMTVLRTTKEAALRAPTKIVELFDVQSIRLDRSVPNIHDAGPIVYKVTLAGDLPLDKAFASDDRQAVKAMDPATKTFELHVTPVREPGNEKNPTDPGKEFLSNCFFVDWDIDAVKTNARQAMVGLPANATDWQKARAVETWVHRNMKSTEFSQAMATCSNVAKSLSGDCTEYAMLSAGMCRALGVPSRTALGLVYAPSRDGKPFLAYHMWFEVYVGGRWVALDATLGRGSIGPGHVKITDASWHEEKSFAPLLPVLSVLGSTPKFEVLRTTDAPR